MDVTRSEIAAMKASKSEWLRTRCDDGVIIEGGGGMNWSSDGED